MNTGGRTGVIIHLHIWTFSVFYAMIFITQFLSNFIFFSSGESSSSTAINGLLKKKTMRRCDRSWEETKEKRTHFLYICAILCKDRRFAVPAVSLFSIQQQHILLQTRTILYPFFILP